MDKNYIFFHKKGWQLLKFHKSKIFYNHLILLSIFLFPTKWRNYLKLLPIRLKVATKTAWQLFLHGNFYGNFRQLISCKYMILYKILLHFIGNFKIEKPQKVASSPFIGEATGNFCKGN